MNTYRSEYSLLNFLFLLSLSNCKTGNNNQEKLFPLFIPPENDVSTAELVKIIALALLLQIILFILLRR
ncbi:hypothetical protein CEAn_00673 [Coxiella endosymbiont of Amblyomma nuttalli]|nr:hypothetical protein CEAn_00673 [Coxiella endosymbiont of Amblyomma nuttalli]